MTNLCVCVFVKYIMNMSLLWDMSDLCERVLCVTSLVKQNLNTQTSAFHNLYRDRQTLIMWGQEVKVKGGGVFCEIKKNQIYILPLLKYNPFKPLILF